MKNKTHLKLPAENHGEVSLHMFIGPRRRLFQWTTTLLLLLLPWLEVDGKSLLRIDIPGLNLYLFGQVLRIQELYLVMLTSLIFALSFLLVTVVLGRVWCGWLCPQTTLSDVAEWAARRLGLTVKTTACMVPSGVRFCCRESTCYLLFW